ncbi:MAG: hypothetical protein Q9221_009122 [Calogaya cf. arnoldii]
MLIQSTLFFLTAALSLLYPILCNPIQTPPSPRLSLAATKPLSESPHPLYFIYNPSTEPLPIPAVQACLSAADNILLTKDPHASPARIRLSRSGVILSISPSSMQGTEYTWNDLSLTLQYLRSKLSQDGYFASWWTVHEEDGEGMEGETIGNGMLFPGDLEMEGKNGNDTVPIQTANATTTNFSVGAEDFEVDFQFDILPHPLNHHDAEGCLGMASAGITGHNLTQPFPRRGGRLRAGNVVLDIVSLSEEYTWGLFDYTIRRVKAQMLARGWWSCSWEVRKVEEGEEEMVTYARGRMWSPLGEGDVAAA